MTRLNILEQSRALPTLPKWVREDGYGFLYWLAFLLVLEPGNAFRAIRAGQELAFDHEVLRILAAALLGAAVTPAKTADTHSRQGTRTLQLPECGRC
jgi:hypothetical protein